MAAYQHHKSISFILAVAYGSIAFLQFQFPPTQCLLAGFLTGVAGMLPDLDSESGRPVREVFGLFAAVTPFVLMPRVMQFVDNTEQLIVVSIALYMGIRHGGAWLLGSLSVHRGMFHSLPALVIAAEATFLSYQNDMLAPRVLMAGGVAIGYLSHLILDELYSVTWTGLRKSAGTALKLYGKQLWPNALTYALVALLTTLVAWDVGYLQVGE